MNTKEKLTKIFNSSKMINFNDQDKIIIMSDCHRGNGSRGDDFYKNRNIFMAALRYYYINNYIYIELGDGDELWEYRCLKQIIENYKDVFSLMAMFYQKNRFYMLYGNHDIVKKDKKLRNSVMDYCYDEIRDEFITLFPNINIEEGLILQYDKTKDEMLLTHGHQGDFLNDKIWKVARFLVRYVWHPLELIGINNPTSAATNDRKKLIVETNLIDWVKENKKMLIVGHTHKPEMPNVNEPLYFNDGCCVHPEYITGIEITNGSISLVKWSVKTKEDRTLFVNKDTLKGPVKLKRYFNSKYNKKEITK
ncbi:MAG: metallophosphoesterase [Bacilli bacterium]